jgi:hypothetical protein
MNSKIPGEIASFRKRGAVLFPPDAALMHLFFPIVIAITLYSCEFRGSRIYHDIFISIKLNGQIKEEPVSLQETGSSYKQVCQEFSSGGLDRLKLR